MGATRPPRKRQRTSASSTSNSVASTNSTSLCIVTTTNKVPGSLTCKSCHRLITIIHGQLFLCSRCSAPTCAICSRTCTARVPSQPPTPHLTWSPSPSPPESPSSSVTNFAANVDLDNNNGQKKITKVTGKRRKDARDDLMDVIHNAGDSDIDDDIQIGCGRIVCRDCCIEDVRSNTISCYDCYGQ